MGTRHTDSEGESRVGPPGAEPGPGSGPEPRETSEESSSRTPAWARRTARAWRHPRLRLPKRIALALALVLLLPLLAAGVALRVNYAGDPAAGTQTRNRDALWMGHAWVDGRKRDADVKALAKRLRGTGIRDLYVHAGPLEHDGTLPGSAHPRARWLVGAVHRELPGVRVQAWLGDKLASEGPVGLRLERAATRTAVVGSTRQILAAGFDGVHFDLEPLHSGTATTFPSSTICAASPAPRTSSSPSQPTRSTPSRRPTRSGALSPVTPSGGPSRTSARSPAGSTRSR
ncbi:hypothetical protein SAV31267_062840 [Streptomyces avermitilis]|uniref:GH18 domain-containing protein n=1 Tax=Streptomyces avermitilis TaxID=33903 RepID=A0A4D4MZQ8_STRAX|nr:hypothetical protein SAV31267_062840 [Streptomyces avermitilis]